MIKAIDNSDFIELVSELAEKIIDRKYRGLDFLVEDEDGGTCYTEEVQQHFNRVYDECEEVCINAGLISIDNMP